MKNIKLIIYSISLILLSIGNLYAQENWSPVWTVSSVYTSEYAQFNPDGKSVLLSVGDLLKTSDGSNIWSLSNVYYPKLSSDGKLIQYHNGSGIYIIDALTAAIVRTIPRVPPSHGMLARIVFSSDNKSLAAADNGYLCEWNVSTGFLNWSFAVDGNINYISFSNDGTKIITASTTGSVQLWNSNNGVLLWSKKIPAASLITPKFNYDDSKLLVNNSTSIQLWKTNDGSVIWNKDYEGGIQSMYFNKDGSRIAYIEGNNIRVSNALDGSNIWVQYNPSFSIAITPEMDRIASSGDDYKVKIWDANNGKLLYSGFHNGYIFGICFSQDGKNLITCGQDLKIKLWSRDRWVKVTKPNGGEKYKYPSKLNVTWDSQNVTNVKLEYSTDNKNSWILAANKVPTTDGAYSIDIPNLLSNQCWIRVSDSDSLQINDTNDQSFQIYQPVTVTSPNGSEILKGGTSQNITWVRDSVATISIMFSSDNGSTWKLIAGNINAAGGSYLWTVPCINFTQCKIKVLDSNNSLKYDESDNVFAVYKDLELTSPIGSEVWKVNELKTISWTNKGTENIEIDLSRDNGSSWTPIVQSISANVGNYTFLVPNLPSGLCKVRIFDVKNRNISDETPGNFTILQKTLVLISPNGGESLISMKMSDITWQSAYVNNVKIQFSSDNGINWSSIIDKTSSSGQKYTMVVPTVNSTQCKIRITDTEDPTVKSESSNVFTINIPTISVIAPNGGEKWMVSETNEIKWQANYVSNVKIDYSTNGANWINIVNSISSSIEKYFWVLPNIISSTCKIRISDVENALISDLSDNVFEIKQLVNIQDEFSRAMPTKYELYQNYPNPFNPSTIIDYSIVSAGHVSLKVYDLLGKEVAQLVEEEKGPGNYVCKFNCANMPAGVYFYKLQTGNFSATKKLLLLK
jgi:WD40 repeat protein